MSYPLDIHSWTVWTVILDLLPVYILMLKRDSVGFISKSGTVVM